MGKSPAAVAEKPKVTVKGETKALPEERFWKRYSPHFEFPLSSAGSTAMHVLVIVFLGLLLLAASMIWKNQEPPDVVAISIPGGGGGNPNAVGPGPGDGGPAPMPKEDVPPDQVDPKKPVPSVLPDLPTGPIDPIQIPNFKNDAGERAIDPGNAVLEQMKNLDKVARTKLFDGLAAGGGKGGPGQGGGEGTGDGPAKGSGTGDKNGKLSERQERLLRWALLFNTLDGRDYVRQLGLLEAMIAIPEANGDYRLYRDLRQRPAMGELADLNTIKSIYWIDDKPGSVDGICKALNIPSPQGPQVHFVAFFPRELEDKLAKMEIQYLEKNYPGKRLKDIDETRFDVKNNVPIISMMTMKGGR